MNGNNIIREIVKVKDVLPKKQKLLCNYIVLNSQESGMLTVAQIAANAGVGTTTVMRLMETLGYKTYNAFKRDLLSASMEHKSSSYGNRKRNFLIEDGNSNNSTLSIIADDIIKSVENFITPKNIEQFDDAVKLMLNQKKIYVLGLRSSMATAMYFEYAISTFYPNVTQLSNTQEFLFDRIMNITSDDVLVVFSQWPCTKKTIEAARLAKQVGVPIILITNTMINPIAQFADIIIDTNSVSNSSYVVPLMVVVEAFAYEMERATAPRSSQNMEKLEHMLKENNLIIWND